MTEEERHYIGEAWVESGLGEHASVASFARFTLDLMSVAAPPELLQRSIQAMSDEVNHATLCFGVASKFLGRVVSPGRLDLTGVFSEMTTPAQILHATVSEGCVSETISLAYAARAMDQASDDGIRGVLKTIVTDESRHSKLAWDFVQWLLMTKPELRDQAIRSFKSAVSTPYGQPPSAKEFPIAERFGHLMHESKEQLRAEFISSKIVPRAAKLLEISTEEVQLALSDK